MTRRGVVVTGMGLIAATGCGVEAAREALRTGRSGVAPMEDFDPSLWPMNEGAVARDFRSDPASPEDRSVQMLLAAAAEAVGDLPAWLEAEPREREGLGISLGTSQGAVLQAASLHRRFLHPEGLPTPEDRARFAAYRPGYGAERLAREVGARGPVTTFGMVCVSSAMALVEGARWIRDGLCDRVLAGGFEAFSPFVFTGFQVIGALTRSRCRPFDRERDGTVLGEAAGLLLLESEGAARRRGAPVFARVLGGGQNADGVHMTAPDRDGRGLEAAVRAAFDDAGVAPGDVGYVNAHGTGTPFNDSMECVVFSRLFEGRRVPPVSSVKGIFGHTLGAAGAVDAIVTTLALGGDPLPPTVNHQEADPGLDFDFVPDPGRRHGPLRIALSSNAAMGGNNTALLLAEPG
ncbi:beta-ketoacyl-[acyl-carrier-protein] synthase family protein [Myxococcota bacterium]|nr:beta-ketoacyl-[acyl-carrier-protein] synthase family protein [Myxococcota bacterium]